MPNTENVTGHWIVEWLDDSGDEDHDIRENSDSVEQTRAAIERILNIVTWTPEDAEEYGGDRTEPAYSALVREKFDGDIRTGLIEMRGEIVSFRCDEGTLTIEWNR